MGKGGLNPEQKAELVILGIGNPGEVLKLCRQYGVQHFEAFNQSEGKFPRTMERYSRALSRFEKYLKDQKQNFTL